MVIWSYLLLSVPASASLEHVLAPVESEPAEALANDRASATATVDEKREKTASAPLVKVGADEIDLLAEIERQLTARLQPPGKLRLTPITPLPTLARSQPLPEVEITDCPPRITTSSILVRFRLTDSTHAISAHTVSFRVQLLAQVWTPAHRLEIGDPLEAEDVVAREVDLIREPKAVLADETVFNRYELARSIVSERPLVWSDLNPRALVRKGQLVDVLASEGPLSITMKGQATHNGALGEVVTVRNLESKREFPAEVVDENTVRVHF